MIICADFDKTIFFRENQAQTAQNLVTIKKWRNAGNVFILGSNRSLGSLEKTLPSWQEYFDYLILDGGARIMDEDRKMLWSGTFSQEVVDNILSIVKDSPIQFEAKFYNLATDDYEPTPSKSMTKIYFHFQNQADADIFQSKISDINANVLSWHHSQFDFCVEITPRTTNKAAAIYELLKIMHTTPDNITTVGDNDNDYEMLIEFDGYAITGSKIATSHPELLTTPSVADLITGRLQNA